MTAASSSQAPIKVLVVEDHSLVREGIVSIFKVPKDIAVVAEAGNGKEAIEQFQAHRPDITLMDLRMPHLEGLEAIVQIRDLAPQANIIILTTYGTDEDVYQGLQAGARGYLLKDATAEELINAVRQVHGGTRYIPANVAVKLANRVYSEELTTREKEVLELLAAGNGTTQIAEALHVSEGTVKFHINNIFQKLGVSDRTQAVITALRKGIVRITD